MTDTAATEMIQGLVPLAVTLGITADAAGSRRTADRYTSAGASSWSRRRSVARAAS
jgi:hypothetical protein